MCEKVHFPSRKAAARSLNFIRYKRGGMTKKHRPYRCPHCFAWHIGHYDPDNKN